MNKKQQHGVKQGLFSDIWKTINNSKDYSGFGSTRMTNQISIWKDGTCFTISIDAVPQTELAQALEA